MTMKKLTLPSLLVASVFFTGCATQSAPIESAAAIKPATTARSSLPMLKVATDCGKCEVAPNVSTLISESYAAAADKAGMKIGDQATATLTITQYNNRSFFTRFVLGPIGIFFRDEIKATVEIDDRKLTVDENVMIPVRGIETVARKVGETTFEVLNGPPVTAGSKSQ
jgi:hypothetical protein